MENDIKKIWCVYMHTNLINNKKYIGITSLKNPHNRWRSDGSGYKRQTRFWNAIQKYGWENFKHEILLKNETKEYAEKVEKCLIRHYKTRNREYGYNITDGGEGVSGWKPNDEWRRKQSELKKNQVISEETRKKISKANKGHHVSDETREKISKNHADISKENHPMYGKHHRDETRKKISESLKGKRTGEESTWYGKHLPESAKEKMREAKLGTHLSNETRIKIKKWQEKHPQDSAKCVLCVETCQIFASINQAQRELNVSHVGDCCRGKLKSTNGLHFQFTE